ncbi:MAG TPA: UDP-N-acetylmuramate--L-alanine ligase [Patescibacteria group bacterium]|jgi:UDP-N-acetylmuramate--L-alanine ligase|nr:UDP-N-acetylmuramate--L-alanine ligase [Patescibacteria group bacterium]
MLNLENIKSIYFIGIGGVGMSAAAGIASQMGFEVRGSDSKALYDPAKQVLESNGIEYTAGYSAANIEENPADLYVASSGEGQDNAEVAYLIEQGLELHSFSELLAALSAEKLRIVVAGTHGKSTTAGMLGKTLQEIDDSSYMTGAVLQHEDTNFHVGEGHYFVFEGDEYKALHDDPIPKFHQYKADILLLTNLEFDHPDIFSSLEEMQDEFRQLIAALPHDGVAVYNADDISLAMLMHETNIGQVSFAFSNPADFRATNLVANEAGTAFDVAWTKTIAGTTNKAEPIVENYQINLFGEINVYNALGVIALLRTLGFTQEQVQDGLSSYYGVKRRFELIGESNGITVYDDYAHHPTAVLETLKAARTKFPSRKIWAVFEPHTYSRTSATLPELATAFGSADEVLLAEIYPAREKKTENSITGDQVVEEIAKHHDHVRLVADKDEALALLKAELKPGDVVIVMAVGNFNLLAQDLMV